MSICITYSYYCLLFLAIIVIILLVIIMTIDYKLIGLRIKENRKSANLTQEQLAEKAFISRYHLSAIEAPGMVRAFSMEAFFNIADALEIDPSELIKISLIPDTIMVKNQK